MVAIYLFLFINYTPPLNFVASCDGNLPFLWVCELDQARPLVMPVCTHTARQLDFFTWWIVAPDFPKGQVPLSKCLLCLCLRPTS